MEEQRRWRGEAWVALAAGLAWFGLAFGSGWLAFALAIVPGSMLVAGAVFALLVLGGRWVPAVIAIGGAFGVVAAPLVGLFVSGSSGLLLSLFSIAGCVAGGGLSMWRLAPLPEAPQPEPSLALRGQIALDEIITGQFLTTMQIPSGSVVRSLAGEVAAALEQFDERGWFDDPAAYHEEPSDEEPSAPESPRARTRRVRGIAFEHLEFESGYAPREGEPGRERWLAHKANLTAHGWVLRHREGPRPWLICLHGYGMGFPIIDLAAFDPRFLHERLGLNLLVPVLPLHGPRALGKRSGRGFLEQPLDTLHAMANAIWDLKRWRAWLREQECERVGVYGLSMGGYTAALAASLIDGFECAIAGIPVSDWSSILWYHLPPQARLELEHHGVTPAKLHALYRPISPLSFEPRVARERRAVLAAVCDRIVPPEQAQALIEHWRPGRVEWFQGSHLSTPAKRHFSDRVALVLRDSGLSDASAGS